MNFEYRMRHIADHVSGGFRFEDRGPDFHFLDHVYSKKLINPEAFALARSQSEGPRALPGIYMHQIMCRNNGNKDMSHKLSWSQNLLVDDTETQDAIVKQIDRGLLAGQCQLAMRAVSTHTCILLKRLCSLYTSFRCYFRRRHRRCYYRYPYCSLHYCRPYRSTGCATILLG
ncbi:hypothetical protein GQ607_002352 [Colletotrichum asianum]|uniref:Uncharacterized protein n=1 Tax=Colletotrichum asianum TaxID=702518 RepID=A0A8H3ZSQ6_9PEZI|nr:hypothetical protein GQ607_002352 [Colletotrichum asianum]